MILIDTTVLCQHFPATRVTAYMSSTASTQAFHRHASVVALSVLDARLLPCFHANGSPLDEMNWYVAMSWTLYGHTRPLSTCFTFQNYERIEEIGGV